MKMDTKNGKIELTPEQINEFKRAASQTWGVIGSDILQLQPKIKPKEIVEVVLDADYMVTSGGIKDPVVKEFARSGNENYKMREELVKEVFIPNYKAKLPKSSPPPKDTGKGKKTPQNGSGKVEKGKKAPKKGKESQKKEEPKKGKCFLFTELLKSSPAGLTWEMVESQKWNSNKAHYPGTLGKLVKAEEAYRKDKKMFWGKAPKEVKGNGKTKEPKKPEIKEGTGKTKEVKE